MMPGVPLQDVIRRTMANYDFICRHKGEPGAYEVTQLVNSFLGAFAHPWEAWREDLNGVTLAEAVADGWPSVEIDDCQDERPANLGCLLGLIRNSLAHGNVRFIKGENGDIEALYIWNEWENRREQTGKWKTWGATLTLEALEDFLRCFEAQSQRLPAHRSKRTLPRHACTNPNLPNGIRAKLNCL